ncbi:MAG: bifunctional DNA primase/polymerase [Thermoguttaceae bacterium]
MSDILRAQKDEAHVTGPELIGDIIRREFPELVRAALYYGGSGLEVFPCQPNAKRPHGGLAPHGVKDATCDEATIRDWWRKCPTANIGLRAGDELLILDIDTKNGDGFADIAAMEAELGPLPWTPFADTPSGGRHLFFVKPDHPIVGQTKIKWQGRPTAVDIRIGDQYVVAPPSIIDGKVYRFPTLEAYLQRNEAGVLNVAQLSESWIAALPSRDYRAAAASAPKTPVCVPRRSPMQRLDDIDRCLLYVNKMDAAVSGSGGHAATYRVACTIFWDFALSESQGWNILWQYNARCQPPWTEAELQHKMESALDPSNKTKPRGWRAAEDRRRA